MLPFTNSLCVARPKRVNFTMIFYHNMGIYLVAIFPIEQGYPELINRVVWCWCPGASFCHQGISSQHNHFYRHFTVWTWLKKKKSKLINTKTKDWPYEILSMTLKQEITHNCLFIYHAFIYLFIFYLFDKTIHYTTVRSSLYFRLAFPICPQLTIATLFITLSVLGSVWIQPVGGRAHSVPGIWPVYDLWVPWINTVSLICG